MITASAQAQYVLALENILRTWTGNPGGGGFNGPSATRLRAQAMTGIAAIRSLGPSVAIAGSQTNPPAEFIGGNPMSPIAGLQEEAFQRNLSTAGG